MNDFINTLNNADKKIFNLPIESGNIVYNTENSKYETYYSHGIRSNLTIQQMILTNNKDFIQRAGQSIITNTFNESMILLHGSMDYQRTLIYQF